MWTAQYPDEADPVRRREAVLFALAFAFLALAAVAQVLAPLARAEEWSAQRAAYRHLPLLPAWVACAWLVHRTLNRRLPRRDPILAPLVYLLAGWGILLVGRLEPEFGSRQLGWLLVATVLLLAILSGPSNLHWLRRYRYVWLSGSVLLTATTLLFGTNPSGGEQRLWLGCCGLYFQPSEPLRLLLLAYLASYLADRLSFRQVEGFRGAFVALLPIFAVSAMSMSLLLIQRDLGTLTLLLAILSVLLYVAAGHWIPLLAGAALVVLGGSLGYHLFETVRLRLQSWVNPWADPISSSYQLVQSLIAIASGGVFGRGPGLGSPGLVPAAHTDFVLAAVAEEWGLWGALFLTGCYAAFVGRGLRTAAKAGEPYGTLLAAGVSVSFGLQSFLIMGGVLRILPLTGITLPLLSYGGSSLVTSVVAAGLLIVLSSKSARSRRFDRPLRAMQLAFSCAWLAVAVALGWWSVVRGEALTSRSDNARRALSSLTSQRGRILDRHGSVLAVSEGARGAYQRSYPHPEASAVVGYDTLSYGQAGVERSFDAILRGETGFDVLTLTWSRLLSGAPPTGHDLKLSLDLPLQQRAFDKLDGRNGAVVVLDPSTGEILALVTSPSFDADRLAEQWQTITVDPRAPLLNRAAQGVYQPGTALGPFLLAWAMMTEQADASEFVADVIGSVEFEGLSWGCASRGTSGVRSDLGMAIHLACPRAHIELGQRLGAQALTSMVRGFLLDRAPEIGIPVASIEAMTPPPDSEGLRRESLGQGSLAVSPLQMARAFSALAAQGVVPGLRLALDFNGPDGSWLSAFTPENAEPAVTADAAAAVLEALRDVEYPIADFSAMAVAGSDSRLLTWYLGATLESAPARVVVVVLEEGSAADVEGIGRALLLEMQD